MGSYGTTHSLQYKRKEVFWQKKTVSAEVNAPEFVKKDSSIAYGGISRNRKSSELIKKKRNSGRQTKKIVRNVSKIPRSHERGTIPRKREKKSSDRGWRKGQKNRSLRKFRKSRKLSDGYEILQAYPVELSYKQGGKKKKKKKKKTTHTTHQPPKKKPLPPNKQRPKKKT